MLIQTGIIILKFDFFPTTTHIIQYIIKINIKVKNFKNVFFLIKNKKINVYFENLEKFHTVTRIFAQ